MNKAIVSKLLELNHKFYQTFAVQFSATRMRLQPGVKGILQRLPQEADILDLGCGNGELARELLRRGHRGRYVGLDFSQALLEEAQAGISREEFTFLPADLSNPDWDANLPGDHFDVVLAFAVLHHLPGSELRRQVVQRVHPHLTPGGRFIHSNWQFLNSARMRSRIQPWERVNLTASDVDPGDYLLDWRRGGYGLRYVHHFSPEGLESLATETGFRVVESFHSDGEGGKLGLYQVWEPV